MLHQDVTIYLEAATEHEIHRLIDEYCQQFPPDQYGTFFIKPFPHAERTLHGNHYTMWHARGQRRR